jgi:hypothetical protein
MASDEVAWAMEMNRLKDDVETFVFFCIDIVATAARSFNALEPFRESLAHKAEDIKQRALVALLTRISGTGHFPHAACAVGARIS